MTKSRRKEIAEVDSEYHFELRTIEVIWSSLLAVVDECSLSNLTNWFELVDVALPFRQRTSRRRLRQLEWLPEIAVAATLHRAGSPLLGIQRTSIVKRLTVAAVTLFSLLAQAQEVTTTTEPAMPARWSAAAGVGFGDSGLIIAGVGSGLGGLSSLQASVPSGRLAFERILTDRFSVGLGLSASYSSAESPLTLLNQNGESLSVQSKSEGGSVALTLAPRWILTEPTFPVAFSVYAAVTGGYSANSFGAVGFEGQGSHAFFASLSGGVAVERMLIDRLAIRISTQILRASVSRSFAKTTATPTVLGSSTTQFSTSAQLGLAPSPSVELRLYF